MNQPSLDFTDRRIYDLNGSISRFHLDFGPGDLISRSIKQDDLLYLLSRVSDIRRQYRN
jgi:hypothetical protein